MLNISMLAFPLATAAAAQVARQVGEAVELGTSFARLLGAGGAAAAAPTAEADGAPGGFEPDVAGGLRRRQTDLQALDADTAALQQVLRAWCSEHGVRLDEPIVIRTDADHRLLVDSNRFDRGAIEEMLQTPSELTAQLRQLFVRAQSLHAPEAAAAERAEVRLVLDHQQAFWAVA